jgi:cellobiose phosphorylase
MIKPCRSFIAGCPSNTTALNGRFVEDTNEFEINTPETPRDWYNYLWNERYVALFSQTAKGESLTQDSMGRRIEIVFNRMLFLRDQETGKFWSLNGLPVDQFRTGYRCIHGLGYSEIVQDYDGIESSFRIFVPEKEACEIWTSKLRNKENFPRKFKAFAFVNTMFDDFFKPQAYYQAKGCFDKNLNSTVISKRHAFDGADEVHIYLTMDREVSGFDCSMNGFVGHGTEQRPDAVIRGFCAGTGSEMEKSCCALEADITISAGETIVFHVIAGGGKERSDISKLREKFFNGDAIKQEFETVKAEIKALLGQDCISTPDPLLNCFFHPWLKRQISLGTQWARVRHNGFRDQMQDIFALSNINPKEAERQLHRVLSYQYSNGYAPRTWIDGEIKDRDFSDNHVWIAFAVYELVMETGDLTLLEKPIPFNDGSTASLYEHVKRAINYLWEDRALFGLIKIRSGDWNDCLQFVGSKGKGVSVWLSMAWYLANRQFSELAKLTGHTEDVSEAARRSGEMKKLVNQHGWDGAWYLRAFNDDGDTLGSHRNEEGRLFLLPQAWAVISGISDGDKGIRAMEACDKYLEIDLGTVKLLDAYTRWDPKIGDSSAKTPGTHENGGVYLHASTFKLMADCMLKRNDKVAIGIHKMLPFDSQYWKKNCEPYIFCNSYFSIKNSYRYGSPGQSWGTGTAAWFYVVMLNNVFGLKPEARGLRVDPCLPPEWKKCSVVRHFRGAEYKVSYDTAKGCKKILEIAVNGESLLGTVLPYRKGGTFEVFVTLE